MKLTIRPGRTYEVEHAAMFEHTGRLHVRLRDARALRDIATEFDGALRAETGEGDALAVHDGPFDLTGLYRDLRDGQVALTLKRREAP